ncbi:MAG TPA: hypothetical protein PKW75_04640 [candidate division Zixibacteria bacterium]|nr:hypothetical protein [candidate division Zixibacteria bacterium]MDD4918658.1 hypothetical protein [candidate division Zixibacteria bacterium]MDM7971728.1 hypothetical protein [candidate division Zixibacteria bacterium]HOD67001.1 hypothetical protein [candidate division Zixibacteria bacterium]HOZ07555.1 hypothetical protein [candidate division Zixibacteria bacterium]
MGRRLPQFIVLVFGAVMFLQYFSDAPAARSINSAVLVDYWQIIFAFTLLVGVVSYVRTATAGIGRAADWPYRAVSLAGVALMPVLAVLWGIRAESPFMWVFENVQVPMQATVFALLAFFVASASYRGFRARSAPAAVLLAAAFLTILTRSALGDWYPDWVNRVAEWVRDVPSMAARRAILIGIGLGSLTTSLRVILGIERTWLGRGGR